jgi:thiosulfate dehydrogenase [quinone] large subunit
MSKQMAEFFREGLRRSAPGWFIGLCRIAFGLMWLHSASWTAPPSFGQGTGTGLWHWIQQAIQYPAFAWHGRFLGDVVLPYFSFFGWLLFLLELSVGLLLLVGLFVRVFSTIGALMSLSLLLGLAAHPAKSFTTYAMMVMFHLLFITTNAGLNWGLDQVLLEKLANSSFRQTPWGRRLMRVL